MASGPYNATAEDAMKGGDAVSAQEIAPPVGFRHKAGTADGTLGGGECRS